MDAVIPRRSFYASSGASTSSAVSSSRQAFNGHSARQRSKQRQSSDDSASEDASSAESSIAPQTDAPATSNDTFQVVVRKTMLAFDGDAKSSDDIAKALRASHPRYRHAACVRLRNDIERLMSRQPCFVKDFLPDGTIVWTVDAKVPFLSTQEMRAKVALKQVLELRKVLTSDQSAKIFAKSTSQAVPRKCAQNKEAEDATSLDQLLDWSPMWKPQFEWRILISCAILGSPRRMMRLEDIVQAIDRKYKYRNVTTATVQKCLNKRPRFYSLKDKLGITWWRVDTEIPGSYLHTHKAKGKLATTVDSGLRANASTYGRRLPSIPSTYALPLDALDLEVAAQASYYAWKKARCQNRADYVNPQCRPLQLHKPTPEEIEPEASLAQDRPVMGLSRSSPQAGEASDTYAPSMAFDSDATEASSAEYDVEEGVSPILGKRSRQEGIDGSGAISSPYAKVKRRFAYIRSALHRITG